MDSFDLQKFAGVSFASRGALSSAQCGELKNLLESGQSHSSELLGGRARTASGKISGMGDVFVKSYARGGFIGRLMKDRHLRLFVTRAEAEFKMLEFARRLGVNAPKPLVWMIEERGLFYRAWLALEKLPTTDTIVTTRQELLDLAIADVARQVKILIQSKVKHVDLHPGNVLVDGDGKVYLVDFDKAHRSSESSAELIEFYIRRWRRAVLKHRLPHPLSELMALELRMEKRI